MLFDKSEPISKIFCELCKNEIKPGCEMIIETVSPSNERQLFSRFYEPSFYSYIDNASKYHKKCYIKKLKK